MTPKSALLCAAAALIFATNTFAAPIAVSVPDAPPAESPFRSGYETAVARAACGMLQSGCKISSARTSLQRTAPQVVLAGASIDATSAPSAAAFVEAVNVLAEDGTLAGLKRHFYDADKPFPGSVTVGTEPDMEAQARRLCEQARARCVFVLNKDFRALAAMYDDKRLSAVVHSQSRLFRSKNLEARFAHFEL